MQISVATLLLAYRQAKQSLNQEQSSPWRLAWAEAERSLPASLARLRRRLALEPGWFSGVDPGRPWLLPKKAAVKGRLGGVRQIGGDYLAPLADLTVRPHLTPSVEFATVEVLWLWQFGPALEASLTDAARGNRLKRVNRKREINKQGIGCFEFWPTQYRGFREDGFAVARSMLSRRRSRCLIATFDLASYYDEIDANFLVNDQFVDSVSERSARLGIAFDTAEYRVATTTLLAAFGRYRAACMRLTGVRAPRGIPVGCLSSKVIANVALSSLDEYAQTRPDVAYYARYVDDILLVARAPRRASATALSMAKAFLPLAARPKGGRRGEIVLDETLLGRPGCQFRLQRNKLRGYLLVGERGRDFLATVERDVKWIASERRAFLLPDGLGTESPISALFLGTDSAKPVNVLREVDQLKVERYAASVAVGKAAVGVELLDRPDSAEWCKQQLSPLAGHMTSPEQWLEFIELALRVVSVCIRANDLVTARTILRRQEVHFDRLGSRRPPFKPSWNGRAVSWARTVKGLREWYERRRLEELAGSLPLPHMGSAAVDSFLTSLLPSRSGAAPGGGYKGQG